MLESLMTNPYAWAFLGACTIFSVVFGIWQWNKSKRKKELSCYKNSYTIVKGGKKVKILNKDKKRKYNKFVENAMVIGLGILIFIMLFFMLLAIFVSVMSMGQKFWESLISAVGSGACVLTMGGTYYKLIKDVYYINIPSGLRKSIGNDEFYK